eukprot:scaffold4595_cov121-Skeletonema_menzelii.AAC.3
MSTLSDEERQQGSSSVHVTEIDHKSGGTNETTLHHLRQQIAFHQDSNIVAGWRAIITDSACDCNYAVLTRVRELGLLEKTAELGILSKLEKNGLTLEKAEALLPKLEELGVLSLVANNQQLLINGVAPLAVEGAPLLLPVVAGALDIGPAAFFLAAAGAGGLDAYLFASGAEVPFIGLPAGAVAGLLLVPLTVVSAGVGVALGSLKN